MKIAVIYSGRFHPFHNGHKQVFDHYASKVGAENVYIATSGKQDQPDRPFSFNDKRKMMMASGIPQQQITQTVRPFAPTEITSKFDMNNTALIFPQGADDSNRFSDSSYMLPYSKGNIQPGSKHGYTTSVPRFDFKVLGKTINSGTEFRSMYASADDRQKAQILSDMYGGRAAALKPIFDQQLTESITVSNNVLLEFVAFINRVQI